MQTPQIRTVLEGLHGTALPDKALENAVPPSRENRPMDGSGGRQHRRSVMLYSNRRRRTRAYGARQLFIRGLLEASPTDLQRAVRVPQLGASVGCGPGSADSNERQNSNAGGVGAAERVFVGLLNTFRVLRNIPFPDLIKQGHSDNNARLVTITK